MNSKLTRTIVGAPFALAVTLVLALLMSGMIRGPEKVDIPVIESEPIEWKRGVIDTEVEPKPDPVRPKPEPIPDIEYPDYLPIDDSKIDHKGPTITIPKDEVPDQFTAIDRGPQAISRFAPPYPPGPKSRGIEGWVLVEFTVSASGAVEDIVIKESHPKGVFDRTVRRTVSKWKYRPAEQNGKSVPVRIEVMLSFNLDE